MVIIYVEVVRCWDGDITTTYLTTSTQQHLNIISQHLNTSTLLIEPSEADACEHLLGVEGEVAAHHPAVVADVGA